MERVKDSFQLVGSISREPTLDRVSDLVHEGEEARSALCALLEHIPEGVIIADAPDGQIRHVSKYCEKLTGRSREELLHIEPDDHPARWDVFERDGVTRANPDDLPLTRALRTGETVVDEEWVLRHADGRFIPILANAGPICDVKGNVTGGVVVFRDISQLKRSHAREVAAKNELERRVTERTAQLEAANREMEAFSYSVSHDLRAPLRSFIAQCAYLEEDHAAVLKGEPMAHLMKMKLAANDMAELIENLLMLSRLTRAEIKRSEVDLTAMFTQTLAKLEHHADVCIDPGMTVSADPGLMKVVVQNLSENAVKFSAKSPEPEINIGFTETPFGRAVYVQDNGVGFDARSAELIFQPFKRLWTEHEYSGSGIGLAIVERVILRHGGRVWAKSAPHKGATFYFVL